MISGFSVVICIPIFFSLFTTAKNLIPIINPFSWDLFFSELDRIIHFGNYPWEILQPILGKRFVSLFISISYKMWFIVKFSFIFWQAFSLKNIIIRERFFITLLLIWIINGFFLATIFSSVGPCYYGHLYNDLPDPYVVLMQYLQEVPTYDLYAQDYLWQAYSGETVMPFSGISAMPSMHVSLAFLFVLVTWEFKGIIRTAYIFYFFIILIGSVHLGWHYAVDGYFSILTTALLWYISSVIVSSYKKCNIDLQNIKGTILSGKEKITIKN
jgi:hypothetical protein